MPTSRGNGSPYCVLVMVDAATCRLKIRLEPGFLLKTKKKGGLRETDWRGRVKGKREK